MRPWRSTILCRSASPRRDTTRHVRPPSSERMKPRNDGRVPGWSGWPEPISFPGPVASSSRNVPTVELLPCALIVPATFFTVAPSRAMRKKPRLVVSRKSFVAGSMSSALTNGGFF